MRKALIPTFSREREKEHEVLLHSLSRLRERVRVRVLP